MKKQKSRDSDADRIRQYLDGSVFPTGILPRAAWGGEGMGGGVNVLHSAEACVTPFKLPVVANSGVHHNKCEEFAKIARFYC